MDVVRQLGGVTQGHLDCLIEALEIVEKPNKVTEQTVYGLAAVNGVRLGFLYRSTRLRHY